MGGPPIYGKHQMRNYALKMGVQTALEEDSDVDFIDFRMVELLVTGDLEKIYLELEEDPDVDLLYG